MFEEYGVEITAVRRKLRKKSISDRAKPGVSIHLSHGLVTTQDKALAFPEDDIFIHNIIYE